MKMQLFKGEENQKSLKEIQSILGKRTEIIEQMKSNTVGSNLYHIVSIKTEDKSYSEMFSESRCNFEKFPKGLLLWINKKQKVFQLAIAYDEIINIQLEKGIENKSKRRNLLNLIIWIFHIPEQKLKFIPQWFLYHIEKFPSSLILKTKEFEISLETHGFNYDSEEKYFTPVINLIN